MRTSSQKLADISNNQQSFYRTPKKPVFNTSMNKSKSQNTSALIGKKSQSERNSFHSSNLKKTTQKTAAKNISGHHHIDYKKNTKINNNKNSKSAISIFHELSHSKQLLNNLSELKRPVIKQAIKLISNTVSPQNQSLSKPYKGNSHTVRNSYSEKKLPNKKYDYLSDDRDCIKQDKYLQKDRSSSYKYITKSTKQQRPILHNYNTDNLDYKRQTNYSHNSHSYLHTSPNYVTPPKYTASKIDNKYNQERDRVLSKYTSIGRSYSHQHIPRDSHKLLQTQNQPLRGAYHKESMLQKNRVTALASMPTTLRNHRNDDLATHKNYESIMNSKLNINRIFVHERSELDTSRIDKINQKLDSYINTNINIKPYPHIY